MRPQTSRVPDFPPRAQRTLLADTQASAARRFEPATVSSTVSRPREPLAPLRTSQSIPIASSSRTIQRVERSTTLSQRPSVPVTGTVRVEGSPPRGRPTIIDEARSRLRPTGSVSLHAARPKKLQVHHDTRVQKSPQPPSKRALVVKGNYEVNRQLQRPTGPITQPNQSQAPVVEDTYEANAHPQRPTGAIIQSNHAQAPVVKGNYEAKFQLQRPTGPPTRPNQSQAPIVKDTYEANLHPQRPTGAITQPNQSQASVVKGSHEANAHLQRSTGPITRSNQIQAPIVKGAYEANLHPQRSTGAITQPNQSQAPVEEGTHEANPHLQRSTNPITQSNRSQAPIVNAYETNRHLQSQQLTVEYEIEVSRRMAPTKDQITFREQCTSEGYLFDTEDPQIFQFAEEGVEEEEGVEDVGIAHLEENIKDVQFVEEIDRTRPHDLAGQTGEPVKTDHRAPPRGTTYADDTTPPYAVTPRVTTNDLRSPPPMNPTDTMDTGQWLDFQKDDEYQESNVLESEYSESIFAYMKTRETELAPDREYLMNADQDISECRLKVINMMAVVCAAFEVLNEVFHLAVHFLDRILAGVDRQYVSTVGMACVLVAVKYEDRRIAVTLYAYVEALCLMGIPVDYRLFQVIERWVLKALNYDLGWPGPLSFLRRVSGADGSEVFARVVAKYILEIITYDPHFLAYKPSMQAASALYIGRRMRTGLKDWPDEFVEESGYTLDDLRLSIQKMVEFLSDENVRGYYVFQKYTGGVFRVAWLTARWIEEGFKVSYPQLASYHH